MSRFIVLFVFLSIHAVAQTDWEHFKLDETVSFRMPSVNELNDDPGQENFLSRGIFGSMQVVKTLQFQAKIANKKELIDYYITFQNNTIQQANGKLIKRGNLSSASTIKLTELYARVFDFEWSKQNLAHEVQENMVLFINGSVYLFAYSCLKTEQARAREERDRFFAGITIYNSDFEDQLTIPNQNERIGNITGWALKYFTILAIIITVIFLVLKKYRYVKLIKSIFAWLFIGIGAISVLVYLTNLFYQNNHYSLLGIGSIFIAIGIVLIKIKVPGSKIPS